MYAIGRLEPQFPSLDVEREFAQVAAGAGNGLPDAALLRTVLTDADNHYLARQMWWWRRLEFWPREEADVTRLVELLPATDAETETVRHVVIGRVAPVSGWIDNPCADSALPLVVPDQLFAFTLDQFADRMAATLSGTDTDDRDSQSADPSAPQKKAAAQASGTTEGRNAAGDTDQSAAQPDPRGQISAVVREVFHRLTRRSGNRGIADEHRALNYLALRYPPVYEAAAQAYREGKSLTAVHAHHSHARDRRLVTVQFVFRHRRSEITERYECVVDVTGFPFLVSGLQPTYG